VENLKSKEYNWQFVTTSQVLSAVPCELVYAEVVPAAQYAATVLYDGVNALGTRIIQFGIAPVLNMPFSPAVPIYCNVGLYIALGGGQTGVFVQWRELMNEEKGV